MAKKLKQLLLFMILACSFLLINSQLTLANTNDTPFLKRLEVQAFINEMVSQHRFKRDFMENLFAQARPIKPVIEKAKNPFENNGWKIYRDFFMDQDRINDGIAFWDRNTFDLVQASQMYGVPAKIIVGIIGVETKYGQNLGPYPTFDALATLAFGDNSRSALFRGELAKFLLLARRYKWDINSIKGSYAGALGIPQFLPSAYSLYAINFKNTGNVDLFNDQSAAIASVGNYLRKHDWQRSQPIAVQAKVKGDQYKNYINEGLQEPKTTVAEFSKIGVEPKTPLSPTMKVNLIQLNSKTPEYWLVTHNFYVISRYNANKLYMMVVFQLGQQIKSFRNSNQKATNKVLAKMNKDESDADGDADDDQSKEQQQQQQKTKTKHHSKHAHHRNHQDV